MLERQRLILNWHDRRIIPSLDWKVEISDKLNSADIVLLLLSPDFLASDYCYEIEMKKAIKLHSKNQLQIVPVMLRPCDWKNSPFSKFLGLPTDMTPVLDESWYTMDEAFSNVTEGLKVLVQELFDNYPDDSIGSSNSDILVDTKIVDVEIKINRDYNTFSDADQNIILEAISNFLKLNKEINIKSKSEGSVLLTFDLNLEDALKLKYGIEDKLFDSQDIVGIEINERDEIVETSEEPLLDYEELRSAILYLRALNHIMRQKIIELLESEEHLTTSDIYIQLRMKQSDASNHLAILRRAHIINTKREGKFIYYSLNRHQLKKIAHVVKFLTEMRP